MFVISSVSASDNSTEEFVFEDLTPTNPEAIDYGQTNELILKNHDDINLTEETLIRSDENFNVTISNRTIDGNATLLIKSDKCLNGNIYFSFLNNESSNLTDGLLSYQFNNLEKGLYKFNFCFENETNREYVYNVSFLIPSFSSDFIPVNDDLAMFYKNGTKFTLTLVDDTEKPIKNQRIKFIVNGIRYNRTTDDNGSASLSLNLGPGTYNISAYYKGTRVHTGLIKNFTFTVLPTLIAEDVVKFYRNGTQYVVTALGKDGNPVSNTTVKININGVMYNRTTNGSGMAKLNINLNPGNYTATAEHEDGCKISNSITVLPSIVTEDLVKIYKNDSQFIIKTVDGNGNATGNIALMMNINGVFYSRVSNDSGLAKLDINLGPGKYIITVENLNDSCKVSNTIIVTPYLFTQDLVKYYKNASQFVAKLVDENYNPISGEKIIFNINDKLYERVTDNEGYCRLSVNLSPGEYNITTTSNQFTVSNKITVLSRLIDLNPQNCTIYSNKNETYDVVVVDEQGNRLANETVDFEYGTNLKSPSKYSLKSDDDGVVRFDPKNNYPGVSYPLTITYNGYSISNNVLFYKPIIVNGY